MGIAVFCDGELTVGVRRNRQEMASVQRSVRHPFEKVVAVDPDDSFFVVVCFIKKLMCSNVIALLFVCICL